MSPSICPAMREHSGVLQDSVFEGIKGRLGLLLLKGALGDNGGFFLVDIVDTVEMVDIGLVDIVDIVDIGLVDVADIVEVGKPDKLKGLVVLLELVGFGKLEEVDG